MSNDAVTAFTEQYAPTAIKVGADTGVAPSILIGQWGLETGWGKSVIPGTNNLGNIKAPKGQGVTATDNANGSVDGYRAYASPDDFGNDFASLMQRRYPSTIGKGNDVAGFGTALQAGGYAEDRSYALKLAAAHKMVPKGIIERAMDSMMSSANAGESSQGSAPAQGGAQDTTDYSAMSDDQLRALAGGQSQEPDYSQMSDAQLAQLAGPQAAPDNTSFAGRVGHGVMNVVQGGAQSLIHALPDSAVNAVNSGAQALNEALPWTKDIGLTPATVPQIDQQTAQREADYQRSRGYQAGTTDIGAGIGELIPQAAMLPFGAAGAGLRGAAVAAGQGAAAGALGGALTPVTDPNADYADTKLGQVAMGAGGGAIAGPVANIAGNTIARVLSPNIRPEVKALLDEGVTPTPGQIIGGAAKRTEDKLTSLPFGGGAVVNAQQRAVEDLNQAAINRATAGVPGVSAPSLSNNGLRGSLDRVQKALSNQYDTILPKVTLKVDNQLSGELNAIEQSAAQLPEAQANRFTQVMNSNFNNNLTPNSTMPGRAFKTVESSLRNEISAASTSPDPYTRQMAQHLRDVRDALRQSLARTNPLLAPQLQAINRGWANYSILRNAGSKVTNPENPFTVAQLQSAVRANNKTVGKGGFAAGNALMQDLSDPAVAVLGNRVPDSGTAGRGLLGAALYGGLGAKALIPGVALNLIYSRPGQAMMAKLLTERPELARVLARQIQQSGAGVGGLLSGQLAGTSGQ